MSMVLVDGYAMMFRSFYAVKFSPLYKGKNINAVYGCASTLLQIIESFSPQKLVVAFDAPQKTFRHNMDKDYKSQREKAPDEFIDQIPLVFDLVKSLDITTVLVPGVEADDIIGILSTQASKKDIKSYIISGDLDFLQLINDSIKLVKFNGATPIIFDEKKTIEKLGIAPNQVIDYKALCGDSSDNYKGIPGIGPKNAVSLLKEYQTLDEIYNHLPALPEKIRSKFETYKDQAYHCQKLARILTDFELPVGIDHLDFQYNSEKISNFLQELGLQSLFKRSLKLNNKITQEDIEEQKNYTKKEPDFKQSTLF